MSNQIQRLIPLLTLLAMLGQAQTKGTPRQVDPDALTESILQASGFRLPPNWTLAAQSRSDASSNSHTEVKIAWDVLPGASEKIRVRDVDAWKNPSSLVLQSVTTQVPGSAGRLDPTMRFTVWAVCLTAANEVCGISRQGDTRWEGAEGASEGSFNTKIALNFWMPNVPAMAKVAVCESRAIFESGIRLWSLHKIGEVQIAGAGR